MLWVWKCMGSGGVWHVMKVTEKKEDKPGSSERCQVVLPGGGHCNRMCHGSPKLIEPTEVGNYIVGDGMPALKIEKKSLGDGSWLNECFNNSISIESADGTWTAALSHCRSPEAGASTDTLLLVGHGRQDLANPVSASGLIGRYVYMCRKGESTLRTFHYPVLPKVAGLAFTKEWLEGDVPKAYIGPHGGGDGLENEKDKFNHAMLGVLKVCDVAVMTRLILETTCHADYRNDGKIPLSDVIRPLIGIGYRKFLLMCCRSPWQPGTTSMQVGVPQSERGLLCSPDDSRFCNVLRVPNGRSSSVGRKLLKPFQYP